MNRRTVSIVLGVLIAGGFLAAKHFIFPEMEIEARKAAGEGWTDAKPEIKGNMISTLREAFVDVDLGHEVLDRTAGCVSDRIVEFLNGTDCDYYYNESTTSEAEHLADQEACLQGIGYEDKELEFTLACAKQHVPSDWNIMHPALYREMDAALEDQIVDAAKRKVAVDCVVKRITGLLGKTGCSPLNPDATTMEQLFSPADQCLEDAGIQAEAEEAIGACISSVL